MPEWLPRVPLALLACARALLIHGEAGPCCTEPLRWPDTGVGARLRGAAGSVPGRVPMRAPVG